MFGSTELAPLKGRFEIIAQSGERYPVDFDEVWQWVGYAKKQNAVELLKTNFEEQLDFLPQKVKSTGGRPLQGYCLTVDCFKAFCMMAGTERGKEVRKYYLAVEKALAAMMKTGGGLTEVQAAQLALLPVLMEKFDNLTKRPILTREQRFREVIPYVHPKTTNYNLIYFVQHNLIITKDKSDFETVSEVQARYLDQGGKKTQQHVFIGRIIRAYPDIGIGSKQINGFDTAVFTGCRLVSAKDLEAL